MFKRICPKCGRLTEYDKNYCEDCQKLVDKIRKIKQAEYDQKYRNKDSKAFYHSKSWQQLSNKVKSDYNGLCVWSLIEENRIVVADVVHHIVPLRDDKELALNVNNLIPLSHKIHNWIEDQYKLNDVDKKKIQERLRELLVIYKNKFNGSRG